MLNLQKIDNNLPTTMKRLLYDLQELESSENVIPGISVFPCVDNMKTLCLILSPVVGPFVGYRLHFKVHLPDDYPSSPPRVECSIYVNHPNVYGDWICCSILRDQVIKGRDGFVSGYCPGYTLKTFFLQILVC
jgi:ubiquitin-protein ligase